MERKYCGVEYELKKIDFGYIFSFKGTKMNSRINLYTRLWPSERVFLTAEGRVDCFKVNLEKFGKFLGNVWVHKKPKI